MNLVLREFDRKCGYNECISYSNTTYTYKVRIFKHIRQECVSTVYSVVDITCNIISFSNIGALEYPVGRKMVHKGIRRRVHKLYE